MSWVSAFLAPAKRRYGVYLTFIVGEFAEEAYRRLSSQREEIDAELDEKVQWTDHGGGKFMIGKYADGVDALVEDQRPAAYAFFRDWINRFVNTFRPRLEAIVRELEGEA